MAPGSAQLPEQLLPRLRQHPIQGRTIAPAWASESARPAVMKRSPGGAEQLDAVPVERMPKAASDAALFGSREPREQHLPVAVDHLVFHQLDHPGRHGPAGELQGFALRDALVEIPIELHEQG